VLAALGVLNFIWGFLPFFSAEGAPDSVPTSIYAVGPGYLPILLLIAGLLALGAVLPQAVRGVQVAVAAVTVGATVGVIVIGFVVGNLLQLAAGGSDASVSKGIGLILLLIFAIVQAVVAVGWWLLDAGVVKSSTARVDEGGATPASAPAGPAGWAGQGAAPAGPPPGPHPGAHSGAPYPGAGPAAAGPVGPPSGGSFPGAGPMPAVPEGPASGAQPGASGSFAGQPSSGAHPVAGYPPVQQGGVPGPGGADGDDDNPEETRQLRF
jgi:hypothetical protein